MRPTDKNVDLTTAVEPSSLRSVAHLIVKYQGERIMRTLMKQYLFVISLFLLISVHSQAAEES
jgi:hypothetical protein